ncbi:hypothetical protein ATCC90586_008621 [Pythium insidiosum]|nr:hypothetical protein ATCC90586_008621 [Pythium insidiosum]
MAAMSSPPRKRSHREDRSRLRKPKRKERKGKKASKKSRKRERERSPDGRKHKRRRHRHRNDSSSDDDSDSDSDSDSGSDSGSEARRHRSDRRAKSIQPDHKVRFSSVFAISLECNELTRTKAALVVVRELLSEFPSIAPELLSLLQMLDDGEVAVLSGISNPRILSQLSTLFPLLGLENVPDVPDAFRVPKASLQASLLETVAGMLSMDGVSGEDKPAAPPTERQKARVTPIGPQIPANMPFPTEDEEDDDADIGPALPGTKGYRQADPLVEAEMERRALEMAERARGGAAAKDAPSASMVREDWMTQMPEKDPLFRDAMGPSVRRSSGKPAAFRSKEPAAIDHSWFDSPEERDRAQRAKMDM